VYLSPGTADIPARVYHGYWDGFSFLANERTNYRKTKRDLKQRPGTKLITGYFGGHNKRYWNRVYADSCLYRWMLSKPARE
jgi:hypothetical protein